jgi:hypothetical protein
VRRYKNKFKYISNIWFVVPITTTSYWSANDGVVDVKERFNEVLPKLEQNVLLEIVIAFVLDTIAATPPRRDAPATVFDK